MSSCRKPQIQNDLPKSPKSSEFVIFLTNSGQKSLTMFISSFFTTIQLNFKNREIKKKSTPPLGFKPAIAGF